MDKLKASQKDIVALMGSLLLLTLLFWSMIEAGLALGFGIVLLAAVAASFIYLRDAVGRTASVTAWLFLGAATVFTPVYALSSSEGLLIAVFFVQSVSWGFWVTMATGHGGGQRKLSDLLPAVFAAMLAPFSGMVSLGEGLGEYSKQRRAEQSENGSAKKRFPWGIVGGILLAIPVVAILFPILTSADAAFSAMMASFNETLARISNTIDEWIASLLLALILAAIFFYPATATLFDLRKREGKQGEIPHEVISGSLLVGFYGTVALLCLAYLFSQLSYLFNGFLGVLPEGLTAAEYARRGFFEIFTFALLSLGMIGIGLFFAKADRMRRILNGLLIFLCGFNLLLIVTAFAKMLLYMQLYGLTEKRLTVTAILIFLAVLFIVLIVGQPIKKFPALPVVLGTAILLFGILSYGEPSRLVAEYNVSAWEDGRLSSVDVELLGDLSDSAIPALIRVYESEDPVASKAAEEELWRIYREKCELYGYVEDTALPAPDGWFGYHHAEHSAVRALNAWLETVTGEE